MTRILIIEDDPKIAGLLSAILTEEGYEIIAAADGATGLEAYHRECPDMLIADVSLPRMDGFTLCRVIRAQSSRVPILFLTGKGEEMDRIVGLEIGGDDYLTKPFRPREMVARVRALLRRADGSAGGVSHSDQSENAT